MKDIVSCGRGYFTRRELYPEHSNPVASNLNLLSNIVREVHR